MMMAEAFIGMFLVVICLIAVAVCLAFYLFEAIGTYRLSKNRGFDKPWMAFIPVASAWVLGGVADNIHYYYGKETRWRVWLTIAESVWLVFYVAYLGMFIPTLPKLFYAAFDTDYLMLADISMAITVLSSMVSLLSLGRTAVKAVVLYKIYQDYTPKNAVVLLVFTVLFGIQPFVLFAIRNNVSATLYWRQRPPVQQPPYPPQY